MLAAFTPGADEQAKGLAGFVYPFKTRSVERILIYLRWKNGHPIAEATVYFESQNTKGEHCIKADSLEQLLPMIKQFLEGIDK